MAGRRESVTVERVLCNRPGVGCPFLLLMLFLDFFFFNLATKPLVISLVPLSHYVTLGA